MARSRIGGGRTKLRGVVGDVIYQISKNPYGDYEQRIINYTREKLNRNTRQQCLARMQIAMFQRCMTLWTPIVKDSYQGVKSGLTSIDHFVSINMKSVQDYCISDWGNSYGFSFPEKGKAYQSFGPFVISEGSYRVPSNFHVKLKSTLLGHVSFQIDFPAGKRRLYDIRKIFGFSYSDAINLFVWGGQGYEFQVGLFHACLRFSKAFGDYSMVTSQNCAQIFEVTTNVFGITYQQPTRTNVQVTFNDSTGVLSVDVIPQVKGLSQWYDVESFLYGTIFSHKKGNIYERNTCRMLPCEELDESSELGRSPREAYYTWDELYDGEDYEDYFL